MSGPRLLVGGATYLYLGTFGPRVAWNSPFERILFDGLLDGPLPDFVLAFTFFAALCYAVLGRWFGRERPAAAMSIALGLALAVGLVWWERSAGLSIRNLGPVAVGLALIVLAGVIYAATQRVGGNWAGVGIAFGACLLIGLLLGVRGPGGAPILALLGLIALSFGGVATAAHRRTAQLRPLPPAAEAASVTRTFREIDTDRRVADGLARNLVQLRNEAAFAATRPDAATDLRQRLRRVLPAEGWLTSRLAQLRAKAFALRAGHVQRIRQLRGVLRDLPPPVREKAAQELAARYAELECDVRLERLDRAVAEVERRVRALTMAAEKSIADGKFDQAPVLLHDAARLQLHNAHLLRLIERTEARMIMAARQILQASSAVKPG